MMMMTRRRSMSTTTIAYTTIYELQSDEANHNNLNDESRLRSSCILQVSTIGLPHVGGSGDNEML